MCRSSSPLLDFSDENQAKGKMPANLPAQETRGTSKFSQYTTRETVQNGVSEVWADQAIAGERREHVDSETGKPVPFDVGDQHRFPGDARQRLK